MKSEPRPVPICAHCAEEMKLDTPEQRSAGGLILIVKTGHGWLAEYWKCNGCTRWFYLPFGEEIRPEIVGRIVDGKTLPVVYLSA